MALYAQTDGKQHTTNSSSWSTIPGLSISLPEGVDTTAIVILNVPFPYATGNSNPGGTFGIAINGAMSPVIAGFTYNEAQPPAYGRIPTTLVVGVPLTMKIQTITGMWQNVRSSTVIIDSPATLSALLS
jgi:mannose-binding lectin